MATRAHPQGALDREVTGRLALLRGFCMEPEGRRHAPSPGSEFLEARGASCAARGYSSGPRHRRPHPPTACTSLPQTTLHALSPASESVSYTHLRAHETDSYLVCR